MKYGLAVITGNCHLHPLTHALFSSLSTFSSSSSSCLSLYFRFPPFPFTTRIFVFLNIPLSRQLHQWSARIMVKIRVLLRAIKPAKMTGIRCFLFSLIRHFNANNTYLKRSLRIPNFNDTLVFDVNYEFQSAQIILHNVNVLYEDYRIRIW